MTNIDMEDAGPRRHLPVRPEAMEEGAVAVVYGVMVPHFDRDRDCWDATFAEGVPLWHVEELLERGALTQTVLRALGTGDWGAYSYLDQ